MKIVMNSAMIPTPGTYEYRAIDQVELVNWMRANAWESYIGYAQTAEHLLTLSGLRVPLSRARCEMRPGDEALICKLAYRIADPATKGAPVPDAWEYGLLRRIR